MNTRIERLADRLPTVARLALLSFLVVQLVVVGAEVAQAGFQGAGDHTSWDVGYPSGPTGGGFQLLVTTTGTSSSWDISFPITACCLSPVTPCPGTLGVRVTQNRVVVYDQNGALMSWPPLTSTISSCTGPCNTIVSTLALAYTPTIVPTRVSIDVTVCCLCCEEGAAYASGCDTSRRYGLLAIP